MTASACATTRPRYARTSMMAARSVKRVTMLPDMFAAKASTVPRLENCDWICWKKAWKLLGSPKRWARSELNWLNCSKRPQPQVAERFQARGAGTARHGSKVHREPPEIG